MAQETRKDPRAKVLTMTVRYKSATVDEFIEHHSHDVSRGGIFIKTPSPFLPGTLLKFEIRIVDDKPMLQGVGRVVWKRDTAGNGPDKPAGMGVKFIKVDEASRNLIDRLVANKGGDLSAYDDEAAVPAGGETPAPAAAMAATPTPAAAAPRAGASAPARPSAGGPPRAAEGALKVRKSTMIGLGAEAMAAAAAQPPRPRSQAPAAPAPAPMFPKTDSEGDMPPPEERTVMKQAAQLLEEALRGAGGSIDELGSPAAAEPPRVPRKPDPAADADKPPPSGRAAPPPRPSDGRMTAEKRPSSRPPTNPAPRAAEAAPALVEPAARKKGGGRVGLSLVLVAGAAAVAYIAMQKQTPAPIDSPPAHAAQAPTPPPTVAPPPTATAAPVETVALPTPPSASAVGSAAAKLTPPSPSVAVTAAVPPTPNGARPAAPVETAAPVEKPVAAPVEKPAAPVAKPKPPKAPAPPVGEEGATPAPAPVEKKPKLPPPPKPSDDNPY